MPSITFICQVVFFSFMLKIGHFYGVLSSENKLLRSTFVTIEEKKKVSFFITFQQALRRLKLSGGSQISSEECGEKEALPPSILGV